MSRLSEVLKQYKMQESEERVLPHTTMQLLRLDNTLADMLGQSDLKSYKELLSGVLEDSKLFKELDKAETSHEALKSVLAFLSTLLDEYIAKPDSFDAPLNADYIKSMLDRYTRMLQPEANIPKEVEKEGEEATSTNADKVLKSK